MLEIIQDVLGAEERAEATVQEARTAATQLRATFGEEETRRVREAQSAADQLVRESLAEARSFQERRVAEAQESLRLAESRFDTVDQPGVERAVQLVMKLVISGNSPEADASVRGAVGHGDA